MRCRTRHLPKDIPVSEAKRRSIVLWLAPAADANAASGLRSAGSALSMAATRSALASLNSGSSRVPIHPQGDEFDGPLDDEGVRNTTTDPDRPRRRKYPAACRGGDMDHPLLRIHKLMPRASVTRLLTTRRPMTAD